MNKDACYTYLHMRYAHYADFFEDFCKEKLPDGDICVPPQHHPVNPEDEDDVVPDQHAAFGIQRATQRITDPVWRDLGLAELMSQGPSTRSTPGAGAGARTAGRGSKGLPR